MTSLWVRGYNPIRRSGAVPRIHPAGSWRSSGDGGTPLPGGRGALAGGQRHTADGAAVWINELVERVAGSQLQTTRPASASSWPPKIGPSPATPGGPPVATRPRAVTRARSGVSTKPLCDERSREPPIASAARPLPSAPGYSVVVMQEGQISQVHGQLKIRWSQQLTH